MCVYRRATSVIYHLENSIYHLDENLKVAQREGNYSSVKTSETFYQSVIESQGFKGGGTEEASLHKGRVEQEQG